MRTSPQHPQETCMLLASGWGGVGGSNREDGESENGKVLRKANKHSLESIAAQFENGG